MVEENKQQSPQERITYTRPDGVEVDVDIVRASMPDLFVALKPPQARPYIMAPRDLDIQKILDFFVDRVQQVEELRADMLKRFAKTDSLKCRYQTGDVAYVMGRPFQLRVYPLDVSKKRPKRGARGRATSKYSLNAEISLLTLYVMHPKSYDEGKLAFNGYAGNIIIHNANNFVRDFGGILMPGEKLPPVRLRAMRDRWSSNEAGALWLSEDIIPYPPDCLVYVVWRELEKKSTIPEEEIRTRFERILPGWRRAKEILQTRPEPYCLQ